MSNYVLDSSALLAVIHDEPGAEAVLEAIGEGAVVSAVNLSEVVAKLSEHGMSRDAIHAALGQIELDVIDFTETLAYHAGLLRASTRALGLSLGDRACLALAAELGVPALTADRHWSQLDLGIDVKVIR